MADSKIQNAKPSKKFQISAPAPGTVTNQIFTPGSALRPILPPPIVRKGYVLPLYVRTGYVELTL